MTAEREALREALQRMLDATDSCQSGYIPGSGPDMEFDEHLKQVREDAREALSLPQSGDDERVKGLEKALADAIRMKERELSEARFTPGPWALKRGNHPAANGDDYVIKAGDEVICAWWDWYDRREMRQANADLIASAPELFDALERITRVDVRDRDAVEVMRNYAFAALALAIPRHPPTPPRSG